MQTIEHDGCTGEGCVETGELCEMWLEDGTNVVIARASERGLCRGDVVMFNRATRVILGFASDVESAIEAL